MSTFVHLHSDHLPDWTPAPDELHPFVRQFLNRFPETPFRLVKMGGVGKVESLMYADGNITYQLPLVWDADKRWYAPAMRSKRDNNTLVAVNMSELVTEYPAFFRLCKTMYSPIPA